MRAIILGYGEYVGFRLTELPTPVLDGLATQYPLLRDDQWSPEYADLLITVGIHGELTRRANGGMQKARVPTLRELAEEIINCGYQQASKRHHPDGEGHHNAQLRLTQARDELRNVCNNFPEETDTDTVIITEPTTHKRRTYTTPPNSITDDDVPF